MKNIYFFLNIVFIILFFSSCLNSESNSKYFIQGLRLDSDAVLKSDEDSLVKLKDLKKPILIFQYSELNCGVCVDSVIVTLKNIDKEIPYIYIADYKRKTDLYLFKRVNKIKKDVYRTNYKTDVDTLNVPYVYILDDKSLVQKSLFIPRKENILDFKEYLDKVSKHYW
ncbi:hypothetical protein LG651_06725 [Tamlana sp. 62-3]|uniref:Thioredoxin domain-containing protein n=1 Tax=Neotamlana sargassicola TaxID=2883125 RepID=A0A9X1I4Y9_9FLAO|nr:hypothetical protein [Tamlana sargassicola]MCB4807941.1 hypothetical protein [Tamlana sargassicola]